MTKLIWKENKTIAQNTKLLRISYQTLSPKTRKWYNKAFDVSVEAHKTSVENRAKPIFPSIAVAKLSLLKLDWGNIYRRCIIAWCGWRHAHYRKDIERLFNPK
jgi:hypothetical protein